MDLRTRIAGEIRRRGPIPFSRYMEMCLYDPEAGYYSRAKEQFGKAGDFYTSSDVHAVFGRLLARQFDEMWRAMDVPPHVDLVELGPGRGLFAQDVLDWSRKKFPDFLDALHYRLVESSPSLRRRLTHRFAAEIDGGKVSVYASVDELASAPSSVVIPSGAERSEAESRNLQPASSAAILFANEFFDALPLEVITDRGSLRIDVDNSNRFVETFAPPSPQEVEFLDRYGVHPGEGERVEAPLLAKNYMERICALVPRGFVLLIDYGYTREELLAGRPKSTVRAFRQHAISDTPYEAPGEQDITAHVNFTALREAGLACMEQGCLVTQSQLLMGIGEPNQFADAFEDARLPQERAKVTLQLKHLVTPVGMGEMFQALLMRRGVCKSKAAKLSGLTFAHCG